MVGCHTALLGCAHDSGSHAGHGQDLGEVDLHGDRSRGFAVGVCLFVRDDSQDCEDNASFYRPLVPHGQEERSNAFPISRGQSPEVAVKVYRDGD